MRDHGEIQRLLSDFDRSGMTQREFADQSVVAYSTFTSWLAKRRRGDFETATPDWVEAPALPMNPTTGKSSDLVLEWPSGLRLHLGAGFDNGEADRVMELVESRCSH